MTLSLEEIKRRLNRNLTYYDKDRIVVTPIFDKDDQLGRVEIDLRLGHQFIIFKEHFQGSLNPYRLSDAEGDISKYQEEVVVNKGKTIVLHPGRFIVGSTLEYVALPKDIEAQVEGRSSWARLGLTIATATTIHPMFKGVVTLELSNNGTIPLELSPGVKIAQIVFHQVEPPLSEDIVESIKGKYQYSIGPGFSKVFKDKYLDYFCQTSCVFNKKDKNL
jgi:dCTP deaminase